jgi:predicted metal-binding protein
MNATNSMAMAAASKAREMGWEVRVCYDQSDVMDYATVVAWTPGSSRVRAIRFIEGEEVLKGWRSIKQVECLLDCSNALG